MANNIIFYFTDQQRWDTCGCYGQPLDITPNLDKLAAEGVRFENAFSPQPVCGPCRALFQTGRYPTETGCFRNNVMLPKGIKTLGEYMEQDAGYETAYIGKWHLASDGELEQKPTIDYTITAIPQELRGGYTGFWRTADVLEFTSHGYDGYVFDENNNRIDFKGYRADCINDFALEYLDQYTGEKPFFMTISQIEPHHQNDRNHYEGPEGSKEKYANFVLPEDLKALGGNAAEEYPDILAVRQDKRGICFNQNLIQGNMFHSFPESICPLFLLQKRTTDAEVIAQLQILLCNLPGTIETVNDTAQLSCRMPF